MQTSVLNKQGNFGVKILWCYTDMAIFVLRCFILTHPVHRTPPPSWVYGIPPSLYSVYTGLHVYVYLAMLAGSVLSKILLVNSNAPNPLDTFPVLATIRCNGIWETAQHNRQPSISL